MIHFYDGKTIRFKWQSTSAQRVLFAVLAAAAVWPPSVRAATIDLNVATAIYPGVSGDWIDYSTNDATVVPAVGDTIYVRNNGAMSINADTVPAALSYRIGAARLDTNSVQQGQPGTLDISAGNVLGSSANGPEIRVGERDDASNTNFTGTVNQTGGVITLLNPNWNNTSPASGGTGINIGVSGITSTPPSTYNMSGGTINWITGNNGNRGIDVRNGTFIMSGNAQILDVGAYINSSVNYQRVFHIARAGSASVRGYGKVVFKGNSLVDVKGGIRTGDSANADAFLEIHENAVVKLREDLQLNASGNTTTAQLDMDSGTLNVGQIGVKESALIVGDSGPGIMNLSGGIVTVAGETRIANGVNSTGTINLTGNGQLITKSLNMRRTAAPIAVGSNFIIDSDNAVFTQNAAVGTGSSVATIGGTGPATFWLKRGLVNFGVGGGTVELGSSATSAPTLTVDGGRMVFNGNVLKTTVASANPVLNFNAGVIEFAASGTSSVWQANFANQGSNLLTKLNSLFQVTLGDATHVANFSMTSGSWDLDIGGHGTTTGADKFFLNSPTGTASFTGGTLNLNYISGFVPVVGDSLQIIRQAAGVPTLNAGAITINAPGADTNWRVETVGSDIRLTYVPEPASCGILAVAVFSGLFAVRRRS